MAVHHFYENMKWLSDRLIHHRKLYSVLSLDVHALSRKSFDLKQYT